MECLKCDYKAPTNQAYQRHLISKKHIQDKPDYRCYTCDYLAKTKQAYERHQAVDCHKPIVFSCDPCGYTTMCRQAYTTHTKSKKHTEGQVKPDYTCQKCFYVAKTKQRYERHQAIDCMTKEPIIYTCIPCEFTSKSKQDYEDHILTQIHCKICTIIKIKDIPSPSYLLQKYHKSAVKMGLHYMGYRRLSYHSKYIVYNNRIISHDEYIQAYQDLENTLKNEPSYGMKYQRYAYILDKLNPDLTYPFSL